MPSRWTTRQMTTEERATDARRELMGYRTQNAQLGRFRGNQIGNYKVDNTASRGRTGGGGRAMGTNDRQPDGGGVSNSNGYISRYVNPGNK